MERQARGLPPPNPLKKKKKISFQKLSYEKGRPDTFKQTLPCEFCRPTVCVFLSLYFLSHAVSGVLSMTVRKWNCTVHWLCSRNHCVLSVIWGDGKRRSNIYLSLHIHKKGAEWRCERGCASGQACRYLICACSDTGEWAHTRDKRREPLKLFFLWITWHVMAHKGKVNWETEVYDRSGMGGRGPGKGAAGWQCAGTHIWVAHMDTRLAIKSFLSGGKLFSAIKRLFCQWVW